MVWALGVLGIFGNALSHFAAQPPIFGGPATVIHSQDFAIDPHDRGWETEGDTNLFLWNEELQHLAVTWDSSKPNSYFRYPLGTIGTAEDDFSVSLDLLLNDIAIGVRPGYPGTFQIAFGFQNRADADKPEFIRGTGANTPNLVEFNFMPDSGFGPTVWPAMFPTNGLMNYSGSGDFGVFELPVGVKMEINLGYTASNHTATLTIRTNGMLVGEVVDAPLVDAQKGFRFDAFSISSYSDEGQGDFPGTILAHGIIDNILVRPPPPPVVAMNGRIISGQWEHEVLTVNGWRYILEATHDFSAWFEVSSQQEGTGEWINFHAPLAGTARFFRVKATR